MSMTVYDLEKTVNLGLATTLKKSKINFGQLFIEIDIAALYATILYLKTKFQQVLQPVNILLQPFQKKHFSTSFS